MSELFTSSSDSNEQLRSNVEQPSTSLKTYLRKDALVEPDSRTFDEIVEFIKGKLELGNGETLYQLGDNGENNCLTEDELAKSTATLSKVCQQLDADYLRLNKNKTKENDEKFSAMFLIRKRVQTKDFKEIRVAVLGNVDAGKSTLLSVLTHGQLDDGRGLARQKLFRHKHEIESGRTSSVGNDILGFDSKGNVVNTPNTHNNNLNWTEICEKSSKLISFIDLPGHCRYGKTTTHGMTGLVPQFCMLMIGANTGGVIGTSKEHLGLSLALKVPLFVVVTKIDSTPENVLNSTLEVLQKILKSSGCRKMPILVQNEEDVVLAANNFSISKVCPIFQISSVTGKNMPLLKMFLNLLSPKVEQKELDKEPAEFQIDETYTVPVGTVVSGLMLKGTIKIADVLMLGPNKLNKFEPVVIRSIHRKRMPVEQVCSGQSASLALKKVKRHEVRKGMVLLSPSLEPKAYQDFYAEILVLHHPTTIQRGYQAQVHTGTVRQTATIISIDKYECLRSGDHAIVKLRFIKNQEYLRPNQNLVFREGRTKAIGKILSVITEPNSSSIANSSISSKKMKKLYLKSKKDDQNENDFNFENKT